MPGDESARRSYRQSVVSKDSDSDIKEEIKYEDPDAGAESLASKIKEQVLIAESENDLPFKIIATERKNYYDWSNNSIGKLLEHIFKDMKINSRINEF